MNATQALREARKRWGKNAIIECDKNGGCIGEDGQWRTRHARVCLHGKHHPHLRECTYDFYLISREPLTLGKVKYPVAEYKVGQLTNVAGFRFFSVRGYAESWEKAFAQAKGSAA